MKTDQLRKSFMLVAVTGVLSLTATGVRAQDDSPRSLDEIIVTAAYREQGLQDVPVSVSAVTGEMMTRTALQKAEDIQFLVPNFTLTETGIGTNAFIRGIGSGINQAFEQSVGTYIDGVYFGRAQQWRAPFLDVERVEVLRGPQSILFGKNSVAGALNISTARPTSEFEGSLRASYEFENDERILEGMLSGPVSDRLRYRLAARTRENEGHMTNVTLGRNEPNREDWTVRGTFEFDVSDNLTATLKAEVSEFDVIGRHIEIINESPALGGPFAGLQYNQILQYVQGLQGLTPAATLGNVVQDEIRTSNGDYSYNDSDNFVLTLNWALGEHNLESITAYSNFEYDEFCDCDFTGAVVFGAALQESYKQISQEFRLSSPLAENFDYIAGLYYQTSEHDFADQITVEANSILVPVVNLLSPGNGSLIPDTQASRLAGVDNDVLSAFAQFNWHLNDNFTLQVGGRITQDQRDGFRTLSITDLDYQPLPAAQVAAPLVYANLFGITSTNLNALAQSPVPQLSVPANALIGLLGSLPVDGSRDKTKVSPEVKLVLDASDNALLYLSWSEGFKSGSFDFRANNKNFYSTMEDSFEFEDENARNIELGGKFTLAGGAFELNSALFSTKYDDLQISIFDGSLGFNVGNAASARVQGLELDMRLAATDNLTVSGGVAFTDFEFEDFENGQCYFGAVPDVDLDGNGTPELCSYTGNSNQLVSDFQGNLTFDYRRPLGSGVELGMLLDVFYTSDYDASATFDPALVQDSYSLFNARLSLGAETGSWDIAVLMKNITDEKILSFGGDTPLSGSSFGAKSNYAFFGTGRTVSLQAEVRF